MICAIEHLVLCECSWNFSLKIDQCGLERGSSVKSTCCSVPCTYVVTHNGLNLGSREYDALLISVGSCMHVVHTHELRHTYIHKINSYFLKICKCIRYYIILSYLGGILSPG